LGKLYEINGKLEICSNGFHFCKNLEDIDGYYDFDIRGHRYFVVEIPDDAEIIDREDKSVTNKIKFIRELTEQDWIDHGMIREMTDKSFHIKYSNGFEQWREYNDQGKAIHYKDSDRFEEWNEYDDQGKLIHIKDSNGYEEWCKYNEQGNLIHYKNSNGFEEPY